jgi:uncharacterized protein involved in exopolysaccharide biosynthesis
MLTAQEPERPAFPTWVSPENEYIDLRVRDRVLFCARLLWGRRGLLAQALAVGLLLGLLLAFLLPKRYDSTTRLMPPDNNRSLPMAMLAGVVGNTLAMPGADWLGLRTSGALFIGVLRSETVADRLIDRFDLKRVYGERLMRDAREKLRDHTAISEDIKSGIIDITVSDSDPARAAALAQAYVEELNRLNAELTTSAAHRERVFIGDRLTVVKRDLDNAANVLSRFASENTAVDIPEQMKAMVGAAATLEGQRIEAQSELSALRQIYSENNVRVRSLRARSEELQLQLNRLRGNTPGSTDSGGPEALYPSIRQLPLLGVKYTDLYRRAKIEEAVYETLTKQLELAKVQEAKEIPTVRVLDPGQYPERRSSPPRLLITILCGLLSPLAVAGWILGTALWNSIDSQDPTRVFVEEVFRTLHPRNLCEPCASSPWENLKARIRGQRRGTPSAAGRPASEPGPGDPQPTARFSD